MLTVVMPLSTGLSETVPGGQILRSQFDGCGGQPAADS
jgi:hypothetical protein